MAAVTTFPVCQQSGIVGILRSRSVHACVLCQVEIIAAIACVGVMLSIAMELCQLGLSRRTIVGGNGLLTLSSIVATPVPVPVVSMRTAVTTFPVCQQSGIVDILRSRSVHKDQERAIAAVVSRDADGACWI